MSPPSPRQATAPNVLAPTVVKDDLSRVICIHWYGEATSPAGAQFLFYTMHLWDDDTWLGDPCAFRVVFIGMAKNWPYPGAIDSWLEATGQAQESAIAWLMAPKPDLSGRIAEKMLGLPVVDSTGKVIIPRQYCDLSVREKVMRAYKAYMDILNPNTPR